tara:strand:+ start:6158 stop:6505 length:348 start_codon:yes stop_codon:yes gene_type:complete
MNRVVLPMRRMLVILESPYAGDVDTNLEYARECLLDSLSRGESPIAFHLLYTQVLDDEDPVQRALGLDASAEWYERANAVVAYTDLGISPGMEKGISLAEHLSIFVEHRKIRSDE